uniref:Cysteine--tRNA ligase, cytoplasmic n=1 Tax=Megaselia scalaris TaxID=36166 RepID=T1GS43_MEGSC
EFFLNVKDLTRHILTEKPSKHFDEWRKQESELQEKYNSSRKQVHEALCDNVDTRTALENLRDLVSTSNIYIRDNKDSLNALLLRKIAQYITDMLHIFGVISGPRGGIGFPVGGNEDSTDILKLCDEIRDEILPNLGVRLEDKDGGAFAVKLVDKDTLLKEKEAKKRAEQEKAAEKEKKKAAAAALAAAKEAQKKIDPKKMFLTETDKYSAFDENGLPTLDKDGKEVSKGQLKKLQKLQQQQETKYKEYLASVTGA